MPRRALREVVHAAIECATVRPMGNWFDTAVRCRSHHIFSASELLEKGLGQRGSLVWFRR